MADVREKSGPAALLMGFLGFVAFEVAAYYLLRYLTSGLGESNEQTERNTIVSNWVKTMAFLVLAAPGAGYRGYAEPQQCAAAPLPGATHGLVLRQPAHELCAASALV
jgi:hypothetical protein